MKRKTKQELAASVYFVVGQGTEGGSESYKISVAGIKDGMWQKSTDPIAPIPLEVGKVALNSGYTIGAMQLDLGVRGTLAVGSTSNVARAGEQSYVDAVIAQSKAYAAKNNLAFPTDTSDLRDALLTHGNGKTTDSGKTRTSITFIDSETRDTINAWSSSSEGRNWIHKNVDMPIVSDASSKAYDVVETYGSSWSDDQKNLAALELAKVYNQTGNLKAAKAALAALIEPSYEDLTAALAGNLHAPKALEIGLSFEKAGGSGMASWLDAAQKKILDSNFDPGQLSSDPDLKLAIRLTQSNGVVVEDGQLSVKVGKQTYRYTMSDDKSTVSLDIVKDAGTSKEIVVGGECFNSQAVLTGSGAVPNGAVSTSVGEDQSSTIGAMLTSVLHDARLLATEVLPSGLVKYVLPAVTETVDDGSDAHINRIPVSSDPKAPPAPPRPPGPVGDSMDSELPDGTRMVSTVITMNGKTTHTAQLVDPAGKVLISAGPGETMERDPDTGVVSVRAPAKNAVVEYHPETGNSTLTALDNTGDVLDSITLDKSQRIVGDAYVENGVTFTRTQNAQGTTQWLDLNSKNAVNGSDLQSDQYTAAPTTDAAPSTDTPGKPPIVDAAFDQLVEAFSAPGTVSKANDILLASADNAIPDSASKQPTAHAETAQQAINIIAQQATLTGQLGTDTIDNEAAGKRVNGSDLQSDQYTAGVKQEPTTDTQPFGYSPLADRVLNTVLPIPGAPILIAANGGIQTDGGVITGYGDAAINVASAEGTAASATPYLHEYLRNQGFTGVTGSTPYKPATAEQTATLRNIYEDTSVTTVPRTVPAGAIPINVNFDGTHNNGQFPADGESPTNIYQLTKLQQRALGADADNSIYMTGVGAQTAPSDALLPNGSPDPASSISNWQALPLNAGAVASAILDNAYLKLESRISIILAENPNAEISLNLAGFSRGGAEAVAFANMLNERGIGPFKPGEVRIANLLLLDPVDQTRGALDTTAPTNVDNTLVMVATGETRYIMPAMPVSDDARIIALPVAHSGLGGSYNPQGTSAVVLAKAREFLEAGGSPLAEIPDNLKPDWSQMFIHNSAVSPNGVPKLGGSETWETDAPNRRYEGSSANSPSVQDALRGQPTYSSIPTDDNGTAAYIATYPDGRVVTKLTENGKLAEVQIAVPQGSGTLTTAYDATGHVKSTTTSTTDDEGNTLLVTTKPDGSTVTRVLSGTIDQPSTSNVGAAGSEFEAALLSAFETPITASKDHDILLASADNAIPDSALDSASNQPVVQVEPAAPAINTIAQQASLATQLSQLGFSTTLHKLPSGITLIANADGDPIGEITPADNGVMHLSANGLDKDGNTTQVSQHITSEGRSLSNSAYTAALLQPYTQGLGLVNSLIGLRNWDAQNDLSHINTVVSLYNQVDNLGGALGSTGNTVLGSLFADKPPPRRCKRAAVWLRWGKSCATPATRSGWMLTGMPCNIRNAI